MSKLKTGNCPKCSRSLPDHLIGPICVNGRHETICPLCALQRINHLHRFPRSEPFRGPNATANFLEACAHLKATGQHISANMRKAAEASRIRDKA